ncbi:hypothetical protein IWQ60_003556 [Tieghemiomyces parasiticus]|uniref:Uncharacterized protein n=1 Tax=Tieghemiomyces parasiticus TaxID=78921 RepID=A0A9W8DWB9_9FUNG|nr:hypothetical protein IWQ60_003556 [Tieghemiomyces parasiticus]
MRVDSSHPESLSLGPQWRGYFVEEIDTNSAGDATEQVSYPSQPDFVPEETPETDLRCKLIRLAAANGHFPSSVYQETTASGTPLADSKRYLFSDFDKATRRAVSITFNAYHQTSYKSYIKKRPPTLGADRRVIYLAIRTPNGLRLKPYHPGANQSADERYVILRPRYKSRALLGDIDNDIQALFEKCLVKATQGSL